MPHVNNLKPLLGKRKFEKDASSPSRDMSSQARSPLTTSPQTVIEMSNYSPGCEFDEDIDTPLFPPGLEKPEWWTDGADDRSRAGKPAVAAIFIHAGAGYHSVGNERLHLEACGE